MNRVFLGLGTNLGDRGGNLRRALSAIDRCSPVTSVSAVYETAPWGVTEQPDFLNLCVRAATDLSPHQLLTFLKGIEHDLGRVTSSRWGPRLIDIDILDYNDLVIVGDDLATPHPRLHSRAFVLAPLAEIAADWTHPVMGLTVEQMLLNVDISTIHRSTLPLTEI